MRLGYLQLHVLIGIGQGLVPMVSHLFNGMCGHAAEFFQLGRFYFIDYNQRPFGVGIW